MWAAAAFLIAFGPMLLEARRSARNERTQRSRGGVEPAGDVYPLMRVVYPVSFAAMIAELIARGVPPLPIALTGALVYLAAKALKWWAIVSLGSCWMFKVITVPGTLRVSTGPYRFMRHPNYVGVMGEFAGFALMTGAIVSGPLAFALFGLILVKRVAVEERALELIGS
jgi:methyltransferase